ncbi:MAG: uridine kinase [Bdellovibrionaceae bacterium]|nr:uridine kinase [Pseudobdellovibrionaceae bacterium]
MSSVLLIGVSGGSGSGKTTFARQLFDYLGPDSCSILYQDSYYFDQSRNFKGDGSINYDHPRAIDFSLMSLHLELLKEGKPIEVPQYCFKTHKRLKETTHFAPKPVIVIDGILILSQPRVRSLFDVSVYIDTPEEERFRRRLERDVQERGRTPEGVIKQFAATVKPMHDQFVESSKKFANFVYPGTENFVPKIIDFFNELETNYL